LTRKPAARTQSAFLFADLCRRRFTYELPATPFGDLAVDDVDAAVGAGFTRRPRRNPLDVLIYPQPPPVAAQPCSLHSDSVVCVCTFAGVSMLHAVATKTTLAISILD
jgi:hypothetical protein